MDRLTLTFYKLEFPFKDFVFFVTRATHINNLKSIRALIKGQI